MASSNQIVAIISKPGRAELGKIAGELVAWLRSRNFSVITDRETAEQVPGVDAVDRDAIAQRHPAFVIVLGGDGTLLAASRAVAKAEIPILGVNLGSLGFLTEVGLADMYATLEAVRADRCHTELRSMLHCQLARDGKCLVDYEALNDVVVSKGAIARMTDFDLFINGSFVSNYKADGLIISTPTGSTAYSLASGGPILAPEVAGFVITPVSPHALTNRPLVVTDAAQIEIAIKSAEGAYLTVDGQVGTGINEGDRVRCRKSEHHVRLWRQKDKTFFDVLRKKLKWGER